MRKLERLEVEDEVDVFLSLVSWGLFRRWHARRKAYQHGIGLKFIPKYELAVFRGHPTRTLPHAPELVFRFRDRKTATEGYHEVAQAIMEGGYRGEAVRDLLAANEADWLE